MSHCVITAVMDTDDPTFPIRPACTIHTCWAPCPYNGDPASTVPLHADPDPSRADALARWELKTHRQRPLVLHRGSWRDEPSHTFDDCCWCDPEFFPAVTG